MKISLLSDFFYRKDDTYYGPSLSNKKIGGYVHDNILKDKNDKRVYQFYRYLNKNNVTVLSIELPVFVNSWSICLNGRLDVGCQRR